MLVVLCKAHLGGLFCCLAKSLTHRRKAVFYMLEPDMAGGRPTDYSTDLAYEICARIAEGESLRSICRCEGMPDAVTVRRWLAAREEFRIQYARAREEQADSLAEEMLDAARKEAIDQVGVADKRVLIDTLKWRAGKLKPKVYSDATNIKLSGDAENPLSLLLTEISGNTLKPK